MLSDMSKAWTVWLNAIWQLYHMRFNWNLRISRVSIIRAGFFGLLLGLVPDNPTSAQVLNTRVVELLGNNCSGLGATGGSPNFGADLNAICQFPPTNSSGAAGSGGSASIQGSVASILNRTILSRMDEIRSEEVQENRSSSAMRMNPFGLLMPGLFRGMSMASPSSPTSDPTGGGTLNFGATTRWKRIGLFASGFVEALNREVGVFQQGYKSTILGFTGGADYRFSKQLTAGLAFTYANQNGDIVNGGNFSTNSYGITLFSQYLPTDNSFVQFSAGYTYNSYLIVRNTFLKLADPGGGRAVNNVGGLPSSNSNGDVFRLGTLTGYDHPIGQFTIGPRVGLNYAHTHIHDYAEQGGQGLGLKFDDQYVNSLQSVLGMQGSVAISTGFGVLVPQINGDYIHEFANSQRFINVQFTEDQRANPFQFRFQTDRPVRNYFNVGTGLVAVLPNGLQPFVNFRAMLGNNQFDNYAGTFGFRMEI